MAILGPSPEPPPVLFEPGMRWVVYREGEGSDREALTRIGAGEAKRAILLGDESSGDDADAITVATLAALRELNPDAHVFLELLTSRNRATVLALGQTERTFLLDVPRFIGLFMLHHLVIPRVERLYHFLLTADGSELYSHVYLESSELEGLARLADADGCISSSLLAEVAEAHDTILVGVFLGEEITRTGTHDLIPTDELITWVNPHASPSDPRLREMGARAGRIPATRIRGLIGVGESYQPVRSFARDLARNPTVTRRRGPAPDVDIGEPEPVPQRILIVGYGDAIASFTHRLAQLIDDAYVAVAFDGRANQLRRLTEGLARNRATLAEAGPRRLRASLERGGRLEVRINEGGAMDAAMDVLAGEAPFEAAVFLSEAEAVDPDARIALRMMRLTERLLSSERPPPRLLAEFISLAKGDRVRNQVTAAFSRIGRTPPRVTLVSTEQVRNYFMVHSAFVPGINEVYGQLLGDRGQDLIRLPVRAARPISMSQMRSALVRRRRVALAFERDDGSVLLNPPPHQAFEGITAVFAIASDGRALPDLDPRSSSPEEE